MTSLSRRELDVVRLIAAAKSNRQIAKDLDLAEGTIKAYLDRIFKKTGQANRTALAVWWERGQMEASQ